VVAKRSTVSGRRVARPKGVEGQFRMVDPRLKKDKRAKQANDRRAKKHGKAKKR
jgi:AdoMet-dependent rRNA methyltransferase SPB1